MEPDHGEDLYRRTRISVLYLQSGSVDAAAHYMNSFLN